MTLTRFLDSAADSAAPSHIASPAYLALLLTALATAGPPEPAAGPTPIGVRVMPRDSMSSTSHSSRIDTDVTMSAVVAALQQLAQHLVDSQEEMDAEDQRLLYANLWDLYA